MRKSIPILFLIILAVKLYGKRVIERPTPELKRIYHVKNEAPEIKHGAFEEYFELKLLVKGNYQQNQKDGKWERYYYSGKIQIEANYKNGKKDGKWVYYFPNGSIKAIIYFNNGLKVGTWESFSVDGKKQAILNYKSDTLFGEQVLYHPNGEIAEYKEIVIEEGKKIIKVSKYYDNGKLFERYALHNNQIQGTFKKYHPSGIIWEDFEYSNNSLLEVKEMKTPTGKPFFKGNFREGGGELRRYHGNGKLYAIEQFKNNQKFGKAQYFDDDVLRIEGFYYNNKPMGTWKYYSIYGKLIEERNFFGSKDYHYLTEYGVSGKERFEGEVLFGTKSGTWKAYNFYGDLLYTTDFKFGYEHGSFERYDGSLLLENGGFFYGEKVGRWKTYNKSQKVVFEEVFNKSVSFDTTTISRKTVAEKFPPDAPYKFEKIKTPIKFPGTTIIEDQYLTNQIKTPEEALRVGVQGTVICYLEIDEFGEVVNSKIQRGIGFGCDEEVKRVLHLLPNYEPGYLHGIPQKIIEIKQFTFGNGS